MPDASDLHGAAEQAVRQARRLGFWARVVLVPVAAIGAVLSFRSLYQAAVPTFGDYLAVGFPLLVDLLILGASLQYVAGAKVGRPMAGWRLTAHAGVVATLVLNALAAKTMGEVPWHVTAPAVWAVLVELTAKQVLGEWTATHAAKADRISLPLWMTAPIESVRTRLLMFRTGITDAHRARIAVGVNAAAREALRLALPRRNARRVRRIINRQLRAGSLAPVAILRPLGWTKGGVVLQNARPDVILQAVLQEILDPGSTPAPVASQAPPPAQRPRSVDPAQPMQHPEAADRQVPQPADRQLERPFARQAEYAVDPHVDRPVVEPMRPAERPVTEPMRLAETDREPGLEPTRPLQQPVLAPRPPVTPPPAVVQEGEPWPVDAGRASGLVQQPERALELGRALHRGRTLQQAGGGESWATTEELRTALATAQAQRDQQLRVEPPPVEPDIFEPFDHADHNILPDTEMLDDTEHLDDLDGQEYLDEDSEDYRAAYLSRDDSVTARR
jgi:uncharacterized protein DUF2637